MAVRYWHPNAFVKLDKVILFKYVREKEWLCSPIYVLTRYFEGNLPEPLGRKCYPYTLQGLHNQAQRLTNEKWMPMLCLRKKKG